MHAAHAHRPDVAEAVFKKKEFVHRLGTEWGLKEVGMFRQGIIWNNDATRWQTQRKLFQNGVCFHRIQHIANACCGDVRCEL